MSGIDCLAFAPHPDDGELFCGGTLIKLKKQGCRTGIIDLTKGELSTNGTVRGREQETRLASQILQLDYRKNLGIPDGNIANSEKNQKKIIRQIRRLRPEICLIPYWQDRHPDHRDASIVLQKSVFLAGLKKVETVQAAHRPKIVLFYMLHQSFEPSFIVDISDEMSQKMEAIGSFASQFSLSENSKERTYINRSGFLETIKTRAAFWGQQVGVSHGEAFLFQGILKIDNIKDFFLQKVDDLSQKRS